MIKLEKQSGQDKPGGLPPRINYGLTFNIPPNRLDHRFGINQSSCENTLDQRKRLPDHWKLNPGRLAVLLHDMQSYFLQPFDQHAEIYTALIRNLRLVLDTCRQLPIPVFYTAQTGRAGQGELPRGLQGDFWGPGMKPIPEHTGIITQLSPVPGEQVLKKMRYSAFWGTGLAQQLVACGRDQLLIGGVYGHIGILATCLEAFQNDISVFVLADGIADFSLPRHQQALDLLSDMCAQVYSTQHVLRCLTGK